MERGGVVLVLVVWVGLVQWARGQGGDSECLLSFKASVGDPEGQLSSWTSGNASSICGWAGVGCFKIFDVPVYKLVLPNFGLTGAWPAGLDQCTSLATLDISFNAFTGPIPGTICSDIPNLVSLNAGNNELGGFVPGTLSTCKYLNDLYLNDNKLEGEIPAEVGLAPRLTHFTVANNDLSGMIPNTLNGQNGGTVRFNQSSFEGNPYLCGAPLTQACRAKPNGGGKASNLGPILGGIVGGVVGLLVVFGAVFWWFVRRSRVKEVAAMRRKGEKLPKEGQWARRVRQQNSIMVAMFDNPVGHIMFADLMTATNDFSEENVLSTSATGTVYKATFADGTALAIKRLKVSSQNERAFRAEMETLGCLKNRNLAPLIGFCIAAGERLLVYEHMPNGSVWDQLHPGGGDGRAAIPWPERVRIATGAARGLGWLHHSCNPRVLHRNINTRSILLDAENEPRISDFGLARLMENTQTHLSTFFNGDYGNVGYVAPEYTRTLTATTKNDVYAFGVVMLELLTGRKPVDATHFQGNLAEWVTKLATSGNAMDAVDPALKGSDSDNEEILRVLKVSIACVSAEPKERPSMFEVYQLLRAIGQKYNYTSAFDELPDMEIWRKDDDDHFDTTKGDVAIHVTYTAKHRSSIEA